MNRISREALFMEKALLIAKRSTCQRAQVGAVFVFEDREIVSGYGGSPPGQPHCSPEICDLTQPCKKTLHAEANGIAWAARKGIPLEGSILFTTLSPCWECAGMLITAGIKKVYYKDGYRDSTPLGRLTESGVIVLPWYGLKDGHKYA